MRQEITTQPDHTSLVDWVKDFVHYPNDNWQVIEEF